MAGFRLDSKSGRWVFQEKSKLGRKAELIRDERIADLFILHGSADDDVLRTIRNTLAHGDHKPRLRFIFIAHSARFSSDHERRRKDVFELAILLATNGGALFVEDPETVDDGPQEMDGIWYVPDIEEARSWVLEETAPPGTLEPLGLQVTIAVPDDMDDATASREITKLCRALDESYRAKGGSGLKLNIARADSDAMVRERV